VLVVDDDAGMRETLVEILAAAGIEAVGAGSAAAAQAMQGELAPALALVDQRLPDGSGIDLGARLKHEDADLTVLLVTGYASLDNAIAAVWELDGFLTKPVPPAELVRVVRAGLDSARLRRENRSLVDDLRQANLLLEESVEARTRELSGLLSLSEALVGAIRLDEVVDACLRTASDVIEARHVGIYLQEGAVGDLLLRAATGDSPLPDRLPRSTLGAPGGEHGTVAPLMAGGRQVGALLFAVTDPIDPMFLTAFAGSAAIAIQNAQRLGLELETVARLSELSSMKSTFLASVSHELRTPLNAVLGFANLLRLQSDTAWSETDIEMIETIIEQGKSLDTMINDLLDTTRAEFGGLHMTLDPIDVGRVIARVTRLFGEATNPLVARVAANLPDVLSNEARLQQVLTNLVVNAVRHSPPNSPIELRAEAEGDHVRLAVVDFGRGIAPEFLPRLFDQFTQVDTAEAGRESGLGLGLYIVRGLVEAMGGTVTVRSEVGRGSEFVVRLRRAGL
jgi:signal transduction histidine kinase/FixJ family two-component response regulator